MSWRLICSCAATNPWTMHARRVDPYVHRARVSCLSPRADGRTGAMELRTFVFVRTFCHEKKETKAAVGWVFVSRDRGGASAHVDLSACSSAPCPCVGGRLEAYVRAVGHCLYMAGPHVWRAAEIHGHRQRCSACRQTTGKKTGRAGGHTRHEHVTRCETPRPSPGTFPFRDLPPSVVSRSPGLPGLDIDLIPPTTPLHLHSTYYSSIGSYLLVKVAPSPWRCPPEIASGAAAVRRRDSSYRGEEVASGGPQRSRGMQTSGADRVIDGCGDSGWIWGEREARARTLRGHGHRCRRARPARPGPLFKRRGADSDCSATPVHQTRWCSGMVSAGERAEGARVGWQQLACAGRGTRGAARSPQGKCRRAHCTFSDPEGMSTHARAGRVRREPFMRTGRGDGGALASTSAPGRGDLL